MSNYSIVPNIALTATADAIRTKSGSQATIEFDHNTGFKTEIDNLEIETYSDGWSRPSDWPNYDLLDMEEQGECCFFTYDGTERNGYDWVAFLAICTNGYTVERGIINSDGSWTADSSTNIASNTKFEAILPTDRDYTVYKIFPTNSGNHITHVRMHAATEINGKTYIDNNTSRGQKCIERYVNLPYCSQFGARDNSGMWATYYLQAETQLDVSSVNSFSRMYMYGQALQHVSINITSNATDLQYMFWHCNSLKYIDTSNWNVSNCTSLTHVFDDCSALIYVDVSHWNVGKATNLNSCFTGCIVLKKIDVSNWDVKNCTNFGGLFYNCYNLQEINVTNWDVSKATDLGGVFSNCRSLTTIDVSKWNTEKCTTLSTLFQNCFSLKSINVSNFDTSLVTNMSSIFSGCKIIKELDIDDWDTSKVTNMNSLFSGANKLAKLNLSKWSFDSNPSMEGMFYDCQSLTTYGRATLPVNITNTGQMFRNCFMLRSINLNGSITKISNYCFYGALHTDYILNLTSVPTLENTGAFRNEAFTQGNCKIYLPSNLVDTAKTTTNWSTYASYIYAIPT